MKVSIIKKECFVTAFIIKRNTLIVIMWMSYDFDLPLLSIRIYLIDPIKTRKQLQQNNQYMMNIENFLIF